MHPRSGSVDQRALVTAGAATAAMATPVRAAADGDLWRYSGGSDYSGPYGPACVTVHR